MHMYWSFTFSLFLVSLQDALTDLTIESEEIQVGDVQEAKAHRGILQAAKYIQMMIDRNGLLVRAFAKTPVRLIFNYIIYHDSSSNVVHNCSNFTLCGSDK